MNNIDFINSTITELATRLANVEIERAKFKAEAEQLTKQNQELQKQVDSFKDQPNDKDNDETKGPQAN